MLTPEEKNSVDKLYYTIGEVAKMLDLSTSLIRYWEKEFDIIKPKKNKKGNRHFTKDDIDNLKLIHHLVKERGMTLKGAQQKIKENKTGTEHNYEIIKKLQDIKDILLAMKSELDA